MQQNQTCKKMQQKLIYLSLFAKEVDLVNLKSNIDKLDIDKPKKRSN